MDFSAADERGKNVKAEWVFPLLVLLLLSAAVFRKQPVYDLFAAGAAEGMQTALKLLPNLAAMLCAVSVMQASGLMDALNGLLAPLFGLAGLPEEIAPLVLVRPVSGSGALAVLSELMEHYGADSRIGLIACTVMASGETIFYTICVYTGAVGERKAGYAIPCALIGSLAGVWLAGMLF